MGFTVPLFIGAITQAAIWTNLDIVFALKGTSIHYFRTEGRGWDQKLIVLEAAQILWYKLEPNVDEGAVVPKAQKIEVFYGCPLHLINKDDQ